jgi:LuxR family transcriptional regulator, maltose regulon positive regulatory protein
MTEVTFPGVVLARTTPPGLPPHFIPRERLLALLDRPAPMATFVIAPSGYGKTTLGAQWAARHRGKAIWHTASENDSVEDTFFYLTQSFRNVFPNFAPWVNDLIPSQFNIEEALDRLVNDVARLEGPINFVFDGTDKFSEAHKPYLQQWANNTPFNMRTVSLRNLVPVVSHSRAAEIGAINIISAADLAFSDEDIAHLADFYEVDMSGSHVQKELKMANGWPAGVHMIMQALSKNHSIEVLFSPTLHEGSLLLNKSISSLNSEIYLFLESLCLYPHFSPELVDKALDVSDSFITLRKLSYEGQFISQLGADSTIFEINPLIRRALQENLRKNPDRYREIALKVIASLDLAESPSFALEVLGELSDISEARMSIHKYIRALYFSNADHALYKWADVIGQSFDLGHYGSKIVRLYADLLSQPVTDFKFTLQEFVEGAKTDGVFSHIQGDLEIMSSRVHFSSGELAQCMKNIRIFPEMGMIQDSAHQAKYAVYLRFAASAAFLAEDFSLLEEIATIVKGLDKQQDGFPLMGVHAISAMMAVADGRYNDARDLSLYVLQLSRKHHYSGISAPYDAAYILAEVYREAGEEDAALKIIEEFLPQARKYQMYPWVVALISKSALIHMQRGSVAEALEAIRLARLEASDTLASTDISRIIDEHELFIRINMRDTERVNELLYRMPETTTIRAVKYALSGGRGMRQEDARSIREMMNFHLVSAHLHLKNRSEALNHIHEAVHIAMPHGYRQIFLMQSPEFRQLFLDFAQTHPNVYVENIASLIRENLKRSAGGGADLKEPLTKRELDILRRLSTGLPINQIAAGLHISNNTIKTHLKNVYKKLGVDSRESAVHKGQELLLL